MAGETAVRDLYNQEARKSITSDEEKNKEYLLPSYVIIRPAAALSCKKPVDVGDLLVQQGDMYSSAESISRMNVAELAVAALQSGRETDFCTLEVSPASRLYKNDDGNFLDLLCLPTKNQKQAPEELDLPKELVHAHCESYSDLLKGLLTDEEMVRSYGSIVSSYRGDESLPTTALSAVEERLDGSAKTADSDPPAVAA